MSAAAIILYGLILLLFCPRHSGRAVTFRDYAIAGGSQGTGLITLSMLASIIGGSATLGMADMAMRKGFPAFWWLGVGSLGLLVQAWLLSRKIRSLNACSLADIAGMVIGPGARTLAALVISISWAGIVAAQFTALAQVFSALAGMEYNFLLLAGTALAVIAYTARGGQLSVLRTDALQCALLFGGAALACLILWRNEQPASIWMNHIHFFNENFGFSDLALLGLLAGFNFIIGPDIFSRNLSARDGACARNAAIFTAAALAIFAALACLLGIWAARHGLASQQENPLLLIARDYLPAPASLILSLGLLSALVSSADTCLLSASTILQHDLLRRDSLAGTRCFVIIIGALALAVSIFRNDIIGLLISAYSIFVPGIAIPLFIAILFHGRRVPNPAICLCGMILGSLCGLSGNLTGINAFHFSGMALSALVTLASFLWGPRLVLTEIRKN